MRDARFVGSALLLLSLVACAVPVASDGGGSPARLILDPSVTRRNPAAGILIVHRDAVAADEGCRHRIFLDGTPVADLRPDEVINIYAVPGRHILRAEQTGSSCHGGNELAATSEVGKGRLFTTTAPSASGTLLTFTAD